MKRIKYNGKIITAYNFNELKGKAKERAVTEYMEDSETDRCTAESELGFIDMVFKKDGQCIDSGIKLQEVKNNEEANLFARLLQL